MAERFRNWGVTLLLVFLAFFSCQSACYSGSLSFIQVCESIFSFVQNDVTECSVLLEVEQNEQPAASFEKRSHASAWTVDVGRTI